MESPQRYFLDKDVYCCDVGDGIVFLDLKSGKYSAIGRAQSIRLAPVVHQWPRTVSDPSNEHPSEPGPAAGADYLVTRGLLTQNSVRGKPAIPVKIDRTDAIELHGRTGDEPRIQIRHVLHFIAAFNSCAITLRFLPLKRIVVRQQTRNRISNSSSFNDRERAVRDLVGIFRRLRAFFYTARDRCLFDSLVLHEFLRRHGIASVWVIGVETRPFGAHSWVQYRTLILNDSLDHVQQFTPIFAV